MAKWRVTLVVDMDVESDDPELAFDYVHDQATKQANFTVIESYDPVELDDDDNPKDFHHPKVVETVVIHDCPNCGGHSD